MVKTLPVKLKLRVLTVSLEAAGMGFIDLYYQTGSLPSPSLLGWLLIK